MKKLYFFLLYLMFSTHNLKNNGLVRIGNFFNVIFTYHSMVETESLISVNIRKIIFSDTVHKFLTPNLTNVH